LAALFGFINDPKGDNFTMKKDEILEKARRSNTDAQGEDELSLAVIDKAGYYASYAGAFLCLVYLIADRIRHKSYTFPLPGSVFFTIFGAMFLYRGIKLKRVHEIVAGGVFAAISAALAAVHFFDLLK
jgi:hypothetical protein